MLNFGSKTFKMLEFTPGIGLLLSDSQHFWFSKNALSESDLKKNSGRGVYRTPKFGHKIQDSQKSVDFLLNRSRGRLGKTFYHL